MASDREREIIRAYMRARGCLRFQIRHDGRVQFWGPHGDGAIGWHDVGDVETLLRMIGDETR